MASSKVSQSIHARHTLLTMLFVKKCDKENNREGSTEENTDNEHKSKKQQKSKVCDLEIYVSFMLCLLFLSPQNTQILALQIFCTMTTSGLCMKGGHVSQNQDAQASIVLSTPLTSLTLPLPINTLRHGVLLWFVKLVSIENTAYIYIYF